MKQKAIRTAACAFAGVFMVMNADLSANATQVSSVLPAAGVGIVLEEGTHADNAGRDGSRSTAPQAELNMDTEQSGRGERSGDTQARNVPEGRSAAQEQDETGAQDETDEQTEAEEAGAYANLVIAQVNSWVNVRSGPSKESKIVGKLYNNSVGELIGQEGDWYYIASGTVTGYVKAEYCVAGEEAEAMVDEVSIRIATVTAGALKLRAGASTESRVLQLLPNGDELKVVEPDSGNGWVKVDVNGTIGYVSAEYVTISVNFVSAESKEEEAARLAKEREAREAAERRAQELAAQEAAAAAAESQVSSEAVAAESPASSEAVAAEPPASSEAVAAPETDAPATADVAPGTQVANFALQFLGNPYVYGGTSLTNGADCSGFVLAVYAHFGVSLPHSAAADQRMGAAVGSLAEAQPGDLICYSGHVGIYIGNNQIVHASTPSGGIKISRATYAPIICIRRIFQ